MEKIPVKLPSKLEDLPHRQALLCLEIEKVCACLPGGLYNKFFLLAVSGGADSVALAIIFYLLAKKNKFSLAIVNINHQLRPESLEEQNFTRTLAQQLGLNFYAETLDTRKMAQDNGIGLEEAGRLGRHKILNDLRLQIRADYILTGHHCGDLTEDILMRLTRGAAWPGLGGMKILDKHWFHPLLYVNPEKLRVLLKSINLSWHEDASNNSLQFTRNRFRHEILPLFIKENGNFTQNAVELNILAQIDADYWHNRLSFILSSNPWKETLQESHFEIFMPKDLLKSCKEAERLRIYMLALRRLKEVSSQPVHARSRTLLKMEACIFKGEQKIFQFPGKVKATVKKEGIQFTVPVSGK